MIGNCETAGLVNSDGGIDCLCLPIRMWRNLETKNP